MALSIKEVEQILDQRFPQAAGNWEVYQVNWGWKLTFDIWNLILVVGVYEKGGSDIPSGSVRVHLCNQSLSENKLHVAQRYGRNMMTNQEPCCETVADLHHALDVLQRDLVSLAGSILQIMEGGKSQADEVDEIVEELDLADDFDEPDLDDLLESLWGDTPGGSSIFKKD